MLNTEEVKTIYMICCCRI